MKRLITPIIITVFWLMMTALLVKKEIMPFIEYDEPPSYRTSLKEIYKPELTSMNFYIGAEKIGVAESLILPQSDGSYRMQSKIELTLATPIIPISNKIRSTTDTIIDRNFQLISTNMKVDTMGFRITIKGKRVGDKLNIEFTTPLGSGKDTIDFPKDAMLSDSLVPLYDIGKIEVGKKWKIQMIDINILGGGFHLIPAWASVEMKEKYYYKDKILNAFRIEIRKNPSDKIPYYTVWVEGDGSILEGQITFGNTIYRLILDKRRKLSKGDILNYSKWEAIK
ncbi:MAG: hypothetical protein A2W17_02590 [Planctomycetes bacterium RBG_16_41_13]|nr:MAG: hypothetical protein A2W17_02590 [Planctomycetes bacterium RBG_16_41_13]